MESRFNSSKEPFVPNLEKPGYQLVVFSELEGVECPCGIAKRGLMNAETVPYSLHLTEISATAKLHYHREITETYFFLECAPDAYMECDGEKVSVEPFTAMLIHPGTRHRAVGEMKVIIVASPKFDPSDEWFD